MTCFNIITCQNQELYATFTRKPKLVVQVWNDRTQKVVNTVELESCQTSSITNDLKWPGETALSVGRNIERGKYHVIFTVSSILFCPLEEALLVP